MAEYIKVQNIGQGFYGIEYDATALGNLDDSTTSPALKPIFKTETFDTPRDIKLHKFHFIKYAWEKIKSYEYVIYFEQIVAKITKRSKQCCSFH